MKREKYFTKDNRKQKIAAWEQELADYYSSKRGFIFDPNSAALLIIDMQKFFLDPTSHAFIPTSKIILESLVNLESEFRKRNIPIIFTRYGLTGEKEEKDLMTEWWAGSLSVSDPLSEFHHSFEIGDSKVITKSTYDSFYKTNLQEVLQTSGVSQIVIGGVHSHLCCETTARSAFCKGFTVWMLIDCLATYTEELHLGTLRAAAHGFGIPISSEKLLEILANEE